MKDRIESHADLHRRFRNVRAIAKALDEGNMGPMVEALPKEYARERYPEFFDEAGSCTSNTLVRKEAVSHE